MGAVETSSSAGQTSGLVSRKVESMQRTTFKFKKDNTHNLIKYCSEAIDNYAATNPGGGNPHPWGAKKNVVAFATVRAMMETRLRSRHGLRRGGILMLNSVAALLGGATPDCQVCEAKGAFVRGRPRGGAGPVRARRAIRQRHGVRMMPTGDDARKSTRGCPVKKNTRDEYHEDR